MRLPRGRTFVVTGALLVAAAVLLLLFVLRLTGTSGAKVKLAPEVFTVGGAARFAGEIARRGPILFQDPLARGTGRNLYLLHAGADPATGWRAVEARLPADTACAVRWTGASFVDCRSGDHGADGADLRSYPVLVDRGQVSVDLRP